MSQNSLEGQKGVGRDLADAALLAGLVQHLGEVGTLERACVVSQPNMAVAVRVLLQVQLPLAL